MSQPWDSVPGWLQQLGTLVGAGGGSVVVLKVIERAFARDDRQAADRTTISSELRQDIRDLKTEVKALQEERETMQATIAELSMRLARAEIREGWSRNRYHRLANWMQSEPGIPSPPAWIFEDIPRDAEPKPPQEPTA